MRSPRADSREAIIEAAARLLREDGSSAVTTRRVAEAAGTQVPTIYRHFGDMGGLLAAVADHVLATYVDNKAADAAAESVIGGDPLEALRNGYRNHVEFGLANPELFALMNGSGREPSQAETAGRDVLRGRVERVAASGMLRVSEQRAAQMISAAGNGAILIMLGTPPEQRDLLLADVMLDAVFHYILTAPLAKTDNPPLHNAVSLAAVLTQLPGLSDAERTLMSEWLDRAITELQEQEI